MSEPLTGTPTRLYTMKEAAEILKVSESWLKKQVAARKVRHVRMGRNVRFTDALLDDIIEKRIQEPRRQSSARTRL